jgi:hypothetical protein
MHRNVANHSSSLRIPDARRNTNHLASHERGRRKDRRYNLSLPLIVCRPGTSKPESQSGYTRDISGRGLYCVVNQDLPVGATVDLIVTLLAEVGSKGAVLLRAHCRIVRIDKPLNDDRKSGGIAAVIESYVICGS